MRGPEVWKGAKCSYAINSFFLLTASMCVCDCSLCNRVCVCSFLVQTRWNHKSNHWAKVEGPCPDHSVADGSTPVILDLFQSSGDSNKAILLTQFTSTTTAAGSQPNIFPVLQKLLSKTNPTIISPGFWLFEPRETILLCGNLAWSAKALSGDNGDEVTFLWLDTVSTMRALALALKAQFFLHTCQKVSHLTSRKPSYTCVGFCLHASVCAVEWSIICINSVRGQAEKRKAESQDLRPLRKRAVWSKTGLARPPHTADEL